MDGKTEMNADFIRTFILGDEDDPLKESVLSAIESECPGALARALWLGPAVRVSDDEPPSAPMLPTVH
jgi:hypothetical protein